MPGEGWGGQGQKKEKGCTKKRWAELKILWKIPPKNPRQNSNQNLGVSRPKSTLQGSGLESKHSRQQPEESHLFFSVAMPADSRREKIFEFVREFAVKYFRIVPVRDSTQQNKA